MYLADGGVAGKRHYLGYRRGPHQRRKLGEVAAANPKTFFQMYWMGSKDDMMGSKDDMVARMERARAAGVAGLIATLDWSSSVGRDWGSPEIPERIDLYTALRSAPQVLTRPRWLYEFARTRWLPDLTAPHLAQPGEAGGRRSSAPTTSGCRPRLPPGRTWSGCVRSGTGRFPLK